MSITQATARSINTAFIALAGQVGVCNVQETETRMGLHRADGNPISKVGPSGIILGTQEVSPMTVASAYGSLAANGIHCTPIPVQSILGADGKELPFDKPGSKNCKQVVDPEVSHGVASIMSAVLTGNGTAARSALDGGPDRRRQDRDDRQEQRDLVRRLHAAADHRRLGRHPARQQPGARQHRPSRRSLQDRLRCEHRRPDVEGDHGLCPRGPTQRRVPTTVRQGRQW